MSKKSYIYKGNNLVEASMDLWRFQHPHERRSDKYIRELKIKAEKRAMLLKDILAIAVILLLALSGFVLILLLG